MDLRSAWEGLVEFWCNPKEEGGQSVADILKMLCIFCFYAMLFVVPIMYWREADNRLMRFLWSDGTVIIADVKCAVGWCKR